MDTRRRAGFTLVELLIAVAIIGLLAAVLVPRFVNTRSAAQNGAAQAFAQNVAKWLALVEADDNAVAPGSLVGTCLSAKTQREGAPATLPNSVLDCDVGYASNRYTVTVTSITGKGGPSNNGVFTATY